MKPRPLSTSIASLYFAPDTEGTPAGGTAAAPPAVSAADSPTGAPIPTAPSKEPGKVTQIQPSPKVKQTGVLNVREALKLTESPRKANDDEAKEIRRKAEGDTVIKVPKSKKAAEPEPGADEAAAAAAKKIEDDKKAADETAAAAAKAAEKPPVTKLKIKDKEMTAEEVAKYIDDLEKKAAGPDPKAAVEDPAKAKLTADQKAAEDKRLDEEFLTKHAEGIGITQAQFDKIIADGDVKGFNRILAERDLANRKWVENVVNPILKDLQDQIDPAIRMHQEVAQYRAEAEFYAKAENADLKGHQKTVRMINETLRTKYPKEFAAMTPAEQETEIATHARSFIKEMNIQPEAAKAAPASPNAAVTPPATPKPKEPQPKPPTGNLTTAKAPVKLGTQRQMIADLEASGK